MPSLNLKTAGVALLSLLASTSLAQTFTDCNPLERDDCPDMQALGVSNYTIDFEKNMMSTRVWNTTAGKVDFKPAGAQFTINRRGDAPTVQTNFYIFFGQVEVIMKAATGTGVVSSVVMQSEDLDEVDWEWIGGNDTHVQSNYFGKGNTTSFDRAIWHPVGKPQDEYHNYTVDWTRDHLEWFIDGQSIRTLKAGEANGGLNFPQTPCNIRLGIWAGGDPKNPDGTIEWAGGETDYKDVPWTMTVKSVRITDATEATQYQWTDRTGSWQSIKVVNDTKPIQLDGENSQSATQSVEQKWNGLPSTTKWIIIGVVIGVVVLILAIFIFCCVKQRRAGKHEKLIEDAKYEKNAAEVLAYRDNLSRQRSNELKSAQYGVTPVMGSAGAMYQNRGQSQPMISGTMSPKPGYGYANSVSTYGSGRGYQKY